MHIVVTRLIRVLPRRYRRQSWNSTSVVVGGNNYESKIVSVLGMVGLVSSDIDNGEDIKVSIYTDVILSCFEHVEVLEDLNV
jgi:hypothetical protein